MDGLRTRCCLLKAKTATLLLLTLLSCVILSCSQFDENKISDLPESAAAFWGDSAAIFIVKNPQNGYRISFLRNKDLIMAHFERGDSISRYCSMNWLPMSISDYDDGTTGVFTVDVTIPVVKVDTLDYNHVPSSDIFFMDVNFDDEDDFLMRFVGNGWINFSCYDLVCNKGNPIEPMQEKPFNQISCGIMPMQSGCTIFDYQKREIFIHHGSGASTFYNIWAKYFEADSLGNPSCVKVVKEERHNFDGEHEDIETYELQGDELKLKKTTKRN